MNYYELYNNFLGEKNLKFGILYAYNIDKTKVIALTLKKTFLIVDEIGIVGAMALMNHSKNKKETYNFLISNIDNGVEDINDYELVNMENEIPIVKKICQNFNC